MNQPKKPHLVHSLSLFSAVMIVTGSMIGSGVFKKMAPMSTKLHSGNYVLLSWVLAGIVTFFGALTYAEISGRIAKTGGLFYYLREAYGDLAGFLFGWTCFSVIQSASIASIAMVFAEALLKFLPTNFSNLGATPTQLIALLTIWSLTFINIRGVKFGALVENIFTVIKMLGILMIASLALSLGHFIPENFSTNFDSVSQSLNIFQNSSSSIPLFFAAMISAFWAFDGFNNVGFLAGEIQHPEKNIPRALLFGVLSVSGIYLLINFAYLYALPLQNILEIGNRGHNIFAVEWAAQIAGPIWGVFVSLLILISAFGATNASLMSSSRIYFAMAEVKLFFKSFSLVHSKFHTPYFSLLAQGIWASVLVFSGSFDDLTDWLIFAAFIFYGLGALSLFRLRKMGIGKPAYKAPTWIVISYIVFCATLVTVNIYQNPKQSLAGLGLILLGLPVYYYLKLSSDKS